MGIALLLAGAVSCLGLVISRTMDRRIPKEAWMDFFMWLVSLAFFSICRFYIYPKHLYRFFVTTNWDRNYLIISAALCMTMFNLLIFIDALSGTYARLLVALNNGQKHAFNESCRCFRCSSQRKNTTSHLKPPLTAFMRFVGDFQKINPQSGLKVSTQAADAA